MVQLCVLVCICVWARSATLCLSLSLSRYLSVYHCLCVSIGVALCAVVCAFYSPLCHAGRGGTGPLPSLTTEFAINSAITPSRERAAADVLFKCRWASLPRQPLLRLLLLHGAHTRHTRTCDSSSLAQCWQQGWNVTFFFFTRPCTHDFGIARRICLLATEHRSL